VLSWRTYLSRFPFLWEDHPIFSGVPTRSALHAAALLIRLVV
jgi:hypothetical protein